MRIATPDDRRLIRTAGIGLILTTGLALGGCGDSGQSQHKVANGGGKGATAGATTTGSAGTGDALKWAKCLRDNGIDAKDPDSSTDGGVVLPDDPDSPALKAAMEKCKQYQTAAGGKTGANGNPDDPKMQQFRLAFAKCMREKGIDWPDPVPGQGMKIPEMTPQMNEATKQCMQEVPGGPK